jgi:hypothetical protein
MEEKMDTMLKMFQTLASSEERELTKAIDEKGVKTIQKDEKLLTELMKMEPSTAVVGTKAGRKRYSLKDLREDLRDPEVAIQKNMVVFERKLEVQQKRLSEEVKAAIEKQGDRVINALEAGPHDKLDDPVSQLLP